MSEWKEVKLGDVILHSCSGGTPKSNVSEYYDGEIPWLNTKEIDFNRIYQTERNITQKGLDNSSAKWIDEKCVIIAMYGATAGKIAINMIPLTTNQACCNLKVDDRLADFRYIYYFLKKDFKFLASLANGGAQQNLNSQIIKDYVIKLPSLSIQKEISDLLWTIDAKIETNNKLNEKLEEMAQAIFKSWFVDFEPFKDKPFHETELGMIPEGWEVGSLSDIATITMGQSPCGTSYNENGEGIIFYQGRTEFGFRFPSIRLYTTKTKKITEVGSTLMSVRAPVGDINMALLRCCIGRGVASIKSNCDCDSYIYYLMKSLKKRFDIYNGEGTVFGSVGRDTLRGLLITIPPSSVISDFEMNISKIDSRIKTNELESQRLASLRDTLLPRLMSGELIV